MSWIQPVTLRSEHVVLEPLARGHASDLVESVENGRLWELWYTVVPPPDGMHVEIERRLGLQAMGEMLPFAVISVATGRAVGMTSYMNVDEASHRVEIGSTWYRQSEQRTALNTHCKLLLLTHAFDVLGCIAVEFRTHSLNRRSRAAIERLGAKLDGVLRSHQRMPNGTLRDTAVYSIIRGEWPTVRAHLTFELGRF
jgi:RimJ/RimL family protein N-acetyltransferase